MKVEMSLQVNRLSFDQSLESDYSVRLSLGKLFKGDKGDRGDTPLIGWNGHWWVSGSDTGVHSRGDKGERGDRGSRGLQGDRGLKGDRGDKGERGSGGATGDVGPRGDRGDRGLSGADGRGIDRVMKVGSLGQEDCYRIYYTDGGTYDYRVFNGSDGDKSKVFADFGLVGSIATIDMLQPNAIYHYLTPITAINVTASTLGDLGLAHIKFTAGEIITINYGVSGIIAMNTDVVAMGEKKHEISILGNDAILFVGQ